MNTTDSKHRIAAAGWIAGTTFGFGLASFGWWNPYLALSVLGAGIVYALTLYVALR